jgi:hypothetical protein
MSIVRALGATKPVEAAKKALRLLLLVATKPTSCAFQDNLAAQIGGSQGG